MPATVGRIEHGRASREWLALREPADAAARSSALAEELTTLPPPGANRDHRADPDRPWVVHDLGSGTGSMRRWLAPRLPVPQTWVEHDHDPALSGTGSMLAAGSAVASACRCDLGGLTAEHLAGADLVTGSALLDVLTAATADRVAAACAQLSAPLLVTLTVTGRVRLEPADPLDADLSAAFNDHQRRATRSGRLLGPGAAGHVAERLRATGAEVLTAPSPWLLGSADTALIAAWLDGWVGAAVEQAPALAGRAMGYRRHRQAEIAAGQLRVTVEHRDLLAWWP